MIDWAKIRTLNDLNQVADSELYDNSADDVNRYELMSNLTPEEKDDAIFWRDYIRGVILITGGEGQGKGMLSHMLGYKFKRYFGITVVSDTRPRPLFGNYVPFSEPFLVDQLDRQKEVADGVMITLYGYNKFADYDEEEIKKPDLKIIDYVKEVPLPLYYLQELSGLTSRQVESSIQRLTEMGIINTSTFQPHVDNEGRWISSRGEVFIRRAVWILDEFGAKYMNRSEPNNPIHRTLLFKVFPIWRHLESVIIGIAQQKEDLDSRFLGGVHRGAPKITTEIRCTRLIVPDNPARLLFGITIYPLRFISSLGELEYTGKKERLVLDADAPRDCLGGKAWKDLYNTKQAVAVEAPNSMRNKRRQ